MNKIVALSTTIVAILVSPVFAEENALNLREGEAVMISPHGTVQKSFTKVSADKHEAALAHGAKEVSGGAVFYNHEGKIYSMTCVGPYLGDWEQGYPGTQKMC